MMMAPFFLFLTIISPFLRVTSSVYDHPFFVNCLPTGDNYTSSSSYGANLSLLLSSLRSSVLKSSVLFSNLSEGSAVYGLAQCRPDANSSVCSSCLERAADVAVNVSCINRKSAFLRYKCCVLSYADRPIVSNLNDPYVTDIVRDDNKARNPDQYRWQVSMMLSDLVYKAAESPRRIAAASRMVQQDIDGGWGGSMNVSVYAWCTMDLTRDDCFQCLNDVLSQYMPKYGDRLGGGAITASCIVTYNNFDFFNISLIQALSSPPPRSDPGSERWR